MSSSWNHKVTLSRIPSKATPTTAHDEEQLMARLVSIFYEWMKQIQSANYFPPPILRDTEIIIVAVLLVNLNQPLRMGHSSHILIT